MSTKPITATSLVKDLLESLELAHEFLDSLPAGWLGKTTGDVGALNDFYIKSRPAMAAAKHAITRPCKHTWVTDKTGLIDTCTLCGEQQA